MYAILNQENSICTFEIRSLSLEELVHRDFRHFYIELPDDHTLKIGDVWHPDTLTWEIIESDTSIVVAEPYQPTNAEVAQMISDLQADLIIAGVI